MTNRRKAVLLAAAAVLIVAALVGTPLALVASASSRLEERPCGTDAYFEALDALELASKFPGFGGRANDIAAAEASYCVGAFANACLIARSGPEDRARAALRARRDAAQAATSDSAVQQAILRAYDRDVDNLDWAAHVDPAERRAFCEDRWGRFSQWLREGDVDADRLCPYCASRGPADAAPGRSGAEGR